MLRRKYELKENMYINFVTKNLKIVVKNLKSNYEKYHREWYFNRKYQLKYSYENN